MKVAALISDGGGWSRTAQVAALDPVEGVGRRGVVQGRSDLHPYPVCLPHSLQVLALGPLRGHNK